MFFDERKSCNCALFLPEAIWPVRGRLRPFVVSNAFLERREGEGRVLHSVVLHRIQHAALSKRHGTRRVHEFFNHLPMRGNRIVERPNGPLNDVQGQ